MKKALALSILLLGAMAFSGCGSKEPAEKPLEGKVDVQDAPAGTVPPGDRRNTTTSESREGN